MAEERKIAWGTAIATLGFIALTKADTIAKFLGIINIPKDARELLVALSQVPTLVSWTILAIGFVALAYLYSEQLSTIATPALRFCRGWELRMPLVRKSVLPVKVAPSDSQALTNELAKLLSASATPKAQPKPQAREFSNLSARELLLLYDGRTALQANKLIEAYVGLWTRADGQVVSIQPEGATTVVVLSYGIYMFKCRFMSDEWEKPLGRINPGDHLAVIGEVHCCQTGAELYLFDCELPPVEPKPQPLPLSPAQKDRKLRALTKLRDQVRNMHPFINSAERLSSGAWNAFVEGRGLEYGKELLDFRDAFDAATRELDALSDQYPEYEDAVAATRMPNREKWIRAIGDHLVVSQGLFTYLKVGTPNEVFVRLASDGAIPFAESVHDYIRWHGFARTNLDHLCRQVAQ